MTNVATPTILSIFSGIGMLDQAIQLAVPDAVTVCHIEREAFAAAVLVSRMEDQSMDEAPIWSNLATFDGKPWCRRVHIIAAGPPCPAYSDAGKREGNSDPRAWGPEFDPDKMETWGPIPHLLRVIGEVRPSLVYLENVPAWVLAGHFRPFGDELCRLGYEIEAPVFLSAADIGASHKRERVFILAHLPRGRAERGLYEGWRSDWQRAADADRDVQIVADAGHLPGCTKQGIEQDRRANQLGGGGKRVAEPQIGGLGIVREPSGGQGQPDGCNQRMADTELSKRRQDDGHAGHTKQRNDGIRKEAGWSGERGEDLEHATQQPEREQDDQARPIARSDSRENAGRRYDSIPILAPAPNDPRWPEILADNPHLSPAIEPGFRQFFARKSMVLDESRADQLRCTGNQVVAIQAAAAFIFAVTRLLENYSQPNPSSGT